MIILYICFVVTAGCDGQCSDSFPLTFPLILNFLHIFTFKVNPSLRRFLVPAPGWFLILMIVLSISMKFA